MISAFANLRRVSLEFIIFCVLFYSMKKTDPFGGIIVLLSGDKLQLVPKDDVSDVAVIFDE